MAAKESSKGAGRPADIILAGDARGKSIPVRFVREGQVGRDAGDRLVGGLSAAQSAWLKTIGFKGAARTHALLPGADGKLEGVLLGIGNGSDGADPTEGNPARHIGVLPGVLPAGVYHLDETPASKGMDLDLAALAWGLGAYRFERYKSSDSAAGIPALKLAKGADRGAVLSAVEAVWLGRDLINTPAGDMGPDELEAAARSLAKRHGAKVSCIKGDALETKNFPLIHAVGRASTRAPRLIDLQWSPAGAPKTLASTPASTLASKARVPTVTLVGKGICFDTGGLDIKPASGMLLMKKDMGGAAAVLALAHMIMAQKLPLRLRVLIPAAENAISGNAFRPGDVITSRAGLTVEIGNTDAEGRLVLADALALADEDAPDYLMTFATLTGAARVALGPDLPPYYTGDDVFADALYSAGLTQCDPLWRMPFWSGYESMLDSPIADLNNVAFGGFAGSITAALFLRRFVKRSHRYAHFDIYGWRPKADVLGPKGGEPQAVRAVFAALKAVLAP